MSQPVLPDTAAPVVLRTDFSDQAAWEAICEALRRPVPGFVLHLALIDERAYEGLSRQQILAMVPVHSPHTFIIVADSMTMRSKDHPLRVIDLCAGSDAEFRATPDTIQAIENNLSVANMGFEELAAAVDGGGIFRGF